MASNELIGGGRALRGCVGCGQTDDHPRHVIDSGADLPIVWHLDCHANAGCESCAAQTKGLTAGSVGSKMLDHIQKQES